MFDIVHIIRVVPRANMIRHLNQKYNVKENVY